MTKQKQRIRKSGKRLLAGILCAAMMFGEFGLAASAEDIHNAGEPTVVTESGEPMAVTEPGADQPVVTTEPETDQPVVTTEPETEQSVTVTEPGENAPEGSTPETDGTAGEETAPETTPTTPSTPEANTPGAGDTAGNETTPADPSVPEGNAPGAGDAAGNETTPVTPSTPEENAPEIETPDTEKPEEEKPETDTEETEEENPEDEKEDKKEKEEADAEDEEKKDDVSLLDVDTDFPNVVYVGTKHGDKVESEPTGQDPAYPYENLADAYRAVNNGGTIKIVDSLTLGSWPTDAKKNVTIEGWTGNIAGQPYNNPMILMEGDWILQGDTTFQKLTIKQNTTGNKAVYPEGHRIQIGSGEFENPEEKVPEDRVAPRVADTFIKDIYNGQSGWFRIVTGPAEGNNGVHIEKVDVHVYGGGDAKIQNWISIVGTAKAGSDTSIVNTPNLKTIDIEMIGSSNETNKELVLPGQFWANGMAPAFDGENLTDVNIALGYLNISTTHSLFRPSGDLKDIRKTGRFSLNYALDNIEFIGNGEAVAFGEAYTTGDMNIDVWYSTFQGTTGRSTFTPCVNNGTFGNIQINLHNSTLLGLGNNYYISGGRNGGLQFARLDLTLDNSHITNYTAFQDNMYITMKGESDIKVLNYTPKRTNNISQTRCRVKNTNTGKLGSVNADSLDIENTQGAELVFLENVSGIGSVTNAGKIHLKQRQTQTWQGNYEGGTEEQPGELVLSAGTTLDIQGKVSGRTVAFVEKSEGNNQITSILAKEGESKCITWHNSLDGTGIEKDSYWTINQGKEVSPQEGCVYVRYGGNDENDGTSYNEAVRSICKAYELATKEKEYKKIVICEAYSFDDVCEKNHTHMETPVVVTTTDGVTNFAADYEAKLLVHTGGSNDPSQGVVNLNHAFEFKNITFTENSRVPQNRFINIYANGHPTVMGEGVETIPGTSIFGGKENDDVESTSLTILDGTYFHIYGGNYRGKIQGNVELIVKNADFRRTGHNIGDSMSIVGGNLEGAVTGNISVKVTPDGQQKVNEVMRIIGGSYGRSFSHMIGNIDVEVSGNVNFIEGAPSPVTTAIIGGNFMNSNLTGAIKVTVCNITGKGEPYIIGGNGMSYPVNGDVSLSVDGVNAYRIVGGCGWTNNKQDTSQGKVTGKISMNIGMTNSVQADSIYGCSADMGSESVTMGNKEYTPESMVMNLGQVSAGTVSGGLMGITVSDDTRDVLSLNVSGESQIRELLEFGTINVAETSTMIYDGTTLTSNTLINNGTIQYQEGSVSVNSDYEAGEEAKIKLNSHTIVTHEKNVSGQTKVASVAGNRALTVRAYTEKIDKDEAEKEQAFVSTNTEKPLVYSMNENMSVWEYDPFAAGTLDFVYVDGQKGNDEWSGTQSMQGENVVAEQDGEEITLGPVKTLDRAYEMIEDGGSIIVCGKTEISRWPNVQKKAFITGDAALVSDSGDTKDYRSENIDEQGAENTGLFFKPGTGSEYLLLEDDLTLRNLDFHYAYNVKNGGIDANGHKLIIGDKSDTGADVTEIKPDVRFYKIQDGKRVKPDTFLLVGGGRAHKELEQIHLEVYNTEVKTVIGLWGGSTETDQSVVKGNVNLILQDCKTSKKNVHYCSNDTLIDLTSGNLFNGGYGVINGDANVSIAFYNNDMNNAFPGSLYGLKRVKNMRDGTLHYINATPHMWQMGVTTTAGMFHAAEKCNIIYESNGNGDIRFDTFYPVDSNTTLDGGENPQVAITLLGKISIMRSALIVGNAEKSNLSVVLNLGNEERGSENISFIGSSKQLVNQSNTNAYSLESYRINYYPGADVKFDMAAQPNITTATDGRPVVALHSLKEDLDKKSQTEYTINEQDFIGHAVLECNNSKVVCNTDLSSKLLDLSLVDKGSFTYDKDDFELNGSLSMKEGTEFNTNGTVSIEKDLKLKENAEFPVENFLDVKGKIESESDEVLLVNNGAIITVGGAAGRTKVNYNGTANKGYFEIRAKKGEKPDSSESYAKEHFKGGTDAEGKEINLAYTNNTGDSYVTWTYGTATALDAIFLADKGSDKNSGESPGEAVQTFERALEKAVEAGESPEKNIIKIVISGKYTFHKDRDGNLDSTLLEKLKGKDIIVTQQVESTGSTYKSNVSIENGFEIPLNLTFENIRLSFTGSNPEFYAGGKVLTIGEGVTVLADGTYPSIYGGHESDEPVENTEVNVYSGTWFRVYGGGKKGSVTGNTKVVLGDYGRLLAPTITTGEEKEYTASTNAVFGGGESGDVTGTAQVIVNYGDQYGYIFGGSESGTVGATEVTVNHKDVKIQRIYGGSYSGKVTGKAQVNFKSGNVNRIYGGGISSDATVASTEVNIGCAGKAASSAIVNHYLRGSGAQGGVTGEAHLNIMDGAYIDKDCNAAAGGYTGGVGKSILNIRGGEIHTDIYAGGAGEFKSENGSLSDEIDPTKGIVSASEVHVTGGTVHGSVYGGGNMGSVGTEANPVGEGATTAKITGGMIKGDFYGGGSLAPTYGDISVTLEMLGNAKVGGGIFGGGKGRAKELGKQGVSADVKGTTTVTVTSAHAGTGIYGGCNLNGNVNKTQVNVNAPTACSIYGGGFGADTYAETTNVDLNLSETFAVESEVTQAASVYGGGEQGKTGTSHVTVQNWKGDVYGGGRGAAEKDGVVTSVKNVFRTIGNAGAVLFTGEKAFAIYGLEDANTKETNVTISGTLVGNAYGGGELATVGVKTDSGESADSTATKTVTKVVIAENADVTGTIYGGGKGKENQDFAMIYGDTSVQMYGGNISGGIAENPTKGAIFGGGEIAPVAGRTNVTVSGGTVQSVFGGNNQSGEIGNGTNAVIKGGNVENAFGGGFGEGAVCQNTSLTINGGHTKTAFAGGNAATVSGEAVLTVNVPGSDVTVPTEVIGDEETAQGSGADEDTEGNADENTDVFAGDADVQTVFAGNNQAAMNIQPTIHLQSGKIDTFYGGGNQGAMTLTGGISYGAETFGSEKILINTVYGGCNSAEVTGGVTLTLSNGTYGEVYGGNNVEGQAHQSNVILDGEFLKVNTVYGGGNQAHIENASVTALDGTIQTIYGGGNAATATDSVKLAVGKKAEAGTSERADESTAEATAEGTTDQVVGNAVITDLYCGNNQAVMDIAPTIDMQKGTVTNFYGGGNRGEMKSGTENQPLQLNYTFDSAAMTIENLYGGGNQADVEGEIALTLSGAKIENAYGGCNEANVKGKATLTLNGADVENTYGGCNTSGQVDASKIIVRGDGANTIYGGGQGEKTTVVNANVTVQNGTVAGNIYGGSGYGRVETSNVIVKEAKDADRIVIDKSVYGGGYGESSVVINSNVTIDMDLSIATKDSTDADLIVTEAAAEEAGDTATDPQTGDAPSGETKTTVSWKEGSENNVSIIRGSVYGGGDMGKVGDGHIKVSTNTADITEEGSANVQVLNGYIKGSVFGGGSGTPAQNLAYTPYMGTVFGTCAVKVQGGFVQESIYGCGHQSRVYAPEAENAKAAVVTIEEPKTSENIFKTESAGSIIIGTSVFGGGNKGEGNIQNASVYTVIGDTVVNIEGIKDKTGSTGIYFLSEQKGGVYGDGNLCLVNGERTINLTDFNYGSADKSLLKTFYSLQRADEVNLTRSRVVLRGAKDLVDVTADDMDYAINRVGQLNMNESSAVKLTTVVNLLGGLTSDQNDDGVYIDKGNNGTNGYTYRGGTDPTAKLDEAGYRQAYLAFQGNAGRESDIYKSFNVVSVANGSYLEIKKSDTEYGAVKGLFTLELLHANPGEGGGFVYADIGDKDVPGSGSTGDFICMTPNESESNAEDQAAKYMAVQDTVGGYMNFQDGDQSDGSEAAKGDYTYYYWYIKGGKYSYKANLKGYIGMTETEFETAVNLSTLTEGSSYILNSISGKGLTDQENSSSLFNDKRFVDYWEESFNTQDRYAIEVCVVPGGDGADLKPISIGYLSYDNHNNSEEKTWGIKKKKVGADNAEENQYEVITGTGNSDTAEAEIIKNNTIYKVQSGVKGLALQFVLHKGTGVTTEFKDVPVTLTFDVRNDKSEAATDDKAHLTVNTFTSITRLVPTQAVYTSSGRLYAGVSTDMPVKITKNSAFTTQFVTKFVPGAFNTADKDRQIQEVLTTRCDKLYLLDPQSGIGFTATADANGDLKLEYATEGEKEDYTFVRTEDGSYTVTYKDAEGEVETHPLTVTDIRQEGMSFPAGTVITLVAQLDEYDPTYWYYYVTEEKAEIQLKDFRRMGTDGTGEKDQYSFKNASGGKISPLYSNRVEEKLTFVFDFSNVPNKTANANLDWLASNTENRLMLNHSVRIRQFDNVDIMDYVSGSTVTNEESDGAEPKYERAHPVFSNTFEISEKDTGLKSFEVKSADERQSYYTKDVYKIGITIEENQDFINTQYEEREYAVVLQQVNGAEDTAKVIPFPEGTMFRYNGENIIAGNQNQSVIIPVKKAGNHEIEMETTLEGFPVGENGAGEVCLKATLYSSSVASYYNNLDTGVERMMTFDVSKRPEAALKIVAVNEGSDGALDESKGEAIEKQIFAGGETVTLNIHSISPEGQPGQAAANTSGKVQNGAGGTDASAGTQNGSGGTDASAGTQNGSDGTDTSAGAQSGAGGTNALPDTQTGTVAIYKYVRKSNTQNPIAFYSKTPLDEVFKNAAASFAADGNGTKWTASIKSNASPGTYRLEFQYEDKTEYWDFVVKE